MKPMKLILSAFGSYGGTECVDFEKMQHGLFLITGDTGAGKTTIFVGISYALYGQTSGRRRDGEMMRSQYAKDTEETYVEFTFSENGEIYTVRRSPNWMRRSKRKNKEGVYALTKVNAKVELIMPDGTVFPGKMKETDQKLIEILGMDMNQFSQVSMISQGDFMKLLRASSKERKEIFSKIFPTQIYWQVQMQLKEQEKQLYVQLENIRNRCRTEIENVQCLPQSIYAQSWKEKGNFSDIDNTEVLELIEKINEETEEKEKLVHDFSVRVERALEAHRRMEENQKKYQVLFNDTRKLEKDIQVLAENMETEQKELQSIRTTYDEDGQLKQNQIFKIRQEMPEYDRLDQEKMELDRIRGEMENHRKSIQKRKSMSETLAKQFDELQKAQEQLKDADIQRIEVKHLLEVSREKYGNIKSLLEKKGFWSKLARARKDGRKQLDEKLRKYQEASGIYDRMYEQFITSQAGLMAKELEDGKPCPVCGSTHHPAPNRSGVSDAMVDQSMVEKAKKTRDYAQAEVERSREHFSDISNQMVTLKNQILYEGSVWMAEADKLVEEGKFWSYVDEAAEKTRNTCMDQEKRLNKLTADVKTYELNKETLKNIETNQKENREKYERLIRQYAVLETEERQHAETINIIAGKLLYASKKEAEKYISKLEDELYRLKIHMEKQEEMVEQHKKKLQLAQGQLEERREKLKQTEQDAVQARCEYIEMVERNNWDVDMDVSQLEHMKRQCLNEEKKLYGIRQSNQNIHRHLKEILHNYKNEQSYYSQIRYLSRVANGELAGTAKIDFQTYMQRRYFKQMVHAANRRLANMNRNEFVLECRDMDHLGRQGEVGLDLDVYSMVNDQVRSIDSLSGGESFMAALALALGMADVIQQEAGKIHVDTLFIDEGFGTLDENARNQAIQVLNELAGGERLVGIISHVRELKEQIGQKIQVEKTEKGSKIHSCHLI